MIDIDVRAKKGTIYLPVTFELGNFFECQVPLTQNLFKKLVHS